MKRTINRMNGQKRTQGRKAHSQRDTKTERMEESVSTVNVKKSTKYRERMYTTDMNL